MSALWSIMGNIDSPIQPTGIHVRDGVVATVRIQIQSSTLTQRIQRPAVES